jgi:hypothetical protein
LKIEKSIHELESTIGLELDKLESQLKINHKVYEMPKLHEITDQLSKL